MKWKQTHDCLHFDFTEALPESLGPPWAVVHQRMTGLECPALASQKMSQFGNRISALQKHSTVESDFILLRVCAAPGQEWLNPLLLYYAECVTNTGHVFHFRWHGLSSSSSCCTSRCRLCCWCDDPRLERTIGLAMGSGGCRSCRTPATPASYPSQCASVARVTLCLRLRSMGLFPLSVKCHDPHWRFPINSRWDLQFGQSIACRVCLRLLPLLVSWLRHDIPFSSVLVNRRHTVDCSIVNHYNPYFENRSGCECKAEGKGL